MQRRSKKNNKKNNQNRSIIPARSTFFHPPELTNYGVTHSRRLRWYFNTSINQQLITFRNICDSILVATSSTALYDLFQSVRVRAIEIWGPGATAAATNTIVVEFAGSDNRIHTDSSVGTAMPTHIFARPSPKSQPALWQIATFGNCFNVSGPAGAIIDLLVDFRNLPSTALAGSAGSSALTTGATYYRGLDGLQSGSSVFTPSVPLTWIV